MVRRHGMGLQGIVSLLGVELNIEGGGALYYFLNRAF